VLTADQLENLRVVLVASRNPLNIGAAARAMSNFGFSRLRVVNPYEIAFREAQSAVGAAELLAEAEEYKTVAEAIADCTLVIGTTAGRDREPRQPFKSLQDAGPIIRDELTRAPIALLFGSEKRGLSNEDLSHCNWLLHIPTQAAHLSMNLGQAVAVCLYEIVRESSATPDRTLPSGRMLHPGSEAPNRATAGELDRLEAVLLEALNESGYTNPKATGSTEEKVRRLLKRVELSSEDAEVLLGMLRQIVWKLKKS
jgi:TrmH family RNA methyltransferase